MVCQTCKMEPDFWLKDCGDRYECIGVYADDLLTASKDSQGIVDNLSNKRKFKLKGTGPMYYHLGYDFSRDENSVLQFDPRK